MTSRLPMKFEKCPQCGCKETIARIAWQEESDKSRVDANTEVAAEHLQTPLVDPKKTIGITSGILILHIDYCAKCGTRYCTKAEVVEGQVKLQPPPGMRQGGPFPPGRRLSFK